EAAGLLTEHEIVAPAEFDCVVGDRATGGKEVPPGATFQGTRLQRQDRVPLADADSIPAIDPCAAQMAIGDLESERMDQVQDRPARRAEACNIACVLRD